MAWSRNIFPFFCGLSIPILLHGHRSDKTKKMQLSLYIYFLRVMYILYLLIYHHHQHGTRKKKVKDNKKKKIINELVPYFLLYRLKKYYFKFWFFSRPKINYLQKKVKFLELLLFGGIMGSGNGSWTTMNLLDSRIDPWSSSIRSVMISSSSIARLLPHHSVSSRITPTTRPGVNDGVVIAIRRIRSSRIHRRSCRDVSRFAHSTIQRVPRTVLGSVPGSVRIVLFNDRRLLLNDLRLRTRTGHRGAQEDVDNQHD